MFRDAFELISAVHDSPPREGDFAVMENPLAIPPRAIDAAEGSARALARCP
jgi:hypothetical protein